MSRGEHHNGTPCTYMKALRINIYIYIYLWLIEEINEKRMKSRSRTETIKKNIYTQHNNNESLEKKNRKTVQLLSSTWLMVFAPNVVDVQLSCISVPIPIDLVRWFPFALRCIFLTDTTCTRNTYHGRILGAASRHVARIFLWGGVKYYFFVTFKTWWVENQSNVWFFGEKLKFRPGGRRVPYVLRILNN